MESKPDFPLIRSGETCPVCSGRKDQGLVTCWDCYKRHDLRNGNSRIAKIIALREARLAGFMTRQEIVLKRHAWLLSELHAGNEFSKDDLWKWLTEAQSVIAGNL
jgi:hypothetical protein